MSSALGPMVISCCYFYSCICVGLMFVLIHRFRSNPAVRVPCQPNEESGLGLTSDSRAAAGLLRARWIKFWFLALGEIFGRCFSQWIGREKIQPCVQRSEGIAPIAPHRFSSVFASVRPFVRPIEDFKIILPAAEWAFWQVRRLDFLVLFPC